MVIHKKNPRFRCWNCKKQVKMILTKEGDKKFVKCPNCNASGEFKRRRR